MAQVAYDPEEIRRQALAASATASNIDAQLDQLRGQMHGMADTWQGPAAVKMREMYENYHRRAHEMTQELTRIGDVLNKVAARCTDTHFAIEKLFDSL